MNRIFYIRANKVGATGKNFVDKEGTLMYKE